MTNQALIENPPLGLGIHITDHGSDWYWSVFSLLTLFTLLLSALHVSSKNLAYRGFHFASSISSFVLAVTYFTMASDLGWTGTLSTFTDNITADNDFGPVRQVFYVRYIGWFLAFPTIVASLGVLAGSQWANIVFGVLSIEAFVVNLLIGSLVVSNYKFGYFAFAILGLVSTGVTILGSFRTAALSSPDTAVVHVITNIGSAFLFLLSLYPISWGLSEGGNVIVPDSEGIFYGVLDILVFVVLDVVLLHLLGTVDLAALGLGQTSHGGRKIEKHEPVDATVTAANAV